MTARKGNILVIFLAAGLVLSLAATGYFFWQNQILKQQTEPGPYPIDQSKTLTPSLDETANWKTYTDSQQRFTFKYPETMTVNTIGYVGGSGEIKTNDFQYVPLNTQQGYRAEMQIYPDSKSLDDQVSLACINAMTGKKIDNCNLSNLTINGYKTVVTENANGVKTFYIYGDKIGVAFFDGVTINDSYKHILDQILSTFKFLTPSPNVMDSWKTYQNPANKFKINYPPGWQIVEDNYTLSDKQGNVRISGQEGSTQIYWGGGFGGGPCPGERLKVETKSGIIDMCKGISNNTEVLSRSNDGIGDTLHDPVDQNLMFSAEIKTPYQINEPKVLEVLETFSWTQ